MALGKQITGDNGAFVGTYHRIRTVMYDYDTDQCHIYIAHYADKQYRDESKVAHAFVPNGYVCLIPDGALGSTWYGTTPEEADLQGASGAEVSIVNTGVAITRILQEHPVNINTFASEIVLPSFERMDEVAVLNVLGE